MNAGLLILCGIGVWLFLEGAAYAVAPDFMKRMAAMMADVSPRDLALTGLVSAAIGAAIVIFAVRAT